MQILSFTLYEIKQCPPLREGANNNGWDFIQKLQVPLLVNSCLVILFYMYIHYYFMHGICICTCITSRCCELTSISCPSLWARSQGVFVGAVVCRVQSPECGAAEGADLLHGSPGDRRANNKRKKRACRGHASRGQFRTCCSSVL